MGHLILTINPGSTSTKTALFEDDREVAKESLKHSVEELAPFRHVADQEEMRRDRVLEFLDRTGTSPADLAAVVGRGGLLKPIPGGTYLVCEEMLSTLRAGEFGEHASNLGAVIAYAIGQPHNVPSYIVDPVVVDELAPEARLSGIKAIERKSIFHALNQRAVAHKAAAELGRTYDQCRFIVVHMGGGITVGAHRLGQVIDVNDGLNGDGPFSPERAGTLPCWDLINLTLSFTYNRHQLQRLLIGEGGMVDYLGCNDMVEVMDRVEKGDQEAALVVRAMAYQVIKQIGAMHAALEGQVDAVVVTGGLAANPEFMALLEPRLAWVGRLIKYPGEMEMEALARGALRVLRGREQARQYC